MRGGFYRQYLFDWLGQVQRYQFPALLYSVYFKLSPYSIFIICITCIRVNVVGWMTLSGSDFPFGGLHQQQNGNTYYRLRICGMLFVCSII